MHRVLIFNTKHEVEGQITEGLVDPVGIAIDTANRFLYVVDTQQDQVIVYDADTLKLLRRIGTGGKNTFPHHARRLWRAAGRGRGSGRQCLRHRHPQQSRGDLRCRRNFISLFGKNGDGPGYFARPKGIASMAMGTSGWPTRCRTGCRSSIAKASC
jgi:hypothetical protein